MDPFGVGEVGADRALRVRAMAGVAVALLWKMLSPWAIMAGVTRGAGLRGGGAGPQRTAASASTQTECESGCPSWLLWGSVVECCGL